MQLDQAPSVVAVVVTNDPGPWLEACLQSLVDQDYGNLSVLVVDEASPTELAGRVAGVAPTAFLWRSEENLGYGPGANVVLDLVEGASFYLFCHDDVVLEAHAVHAMVEEAFRSNAGIVGPKLVDAGEPDRILQLGLGVDRLGAPVPRIEHRELDQAQHDEVAEVFAAPGACSLVRSDLFAAIGGFDPEISLFGEDVDLCWRARLAGARVVVEPSATATHLEATASRRRPCPQARSLQWRHELRAVLKNYGRLRRAVAVFQLVLLSVAEIVYFTSIGKTWRAGQVLDAWRWNLSSERGLKAARAAVAAARRVPEADVCALLTKRTLRVSRFARPLLEARALTRRSLASTRRIPILVESRGHHQHRPRQPRRPRGVVAGAVVVTIVLVFGSRSLLAGGIPVVGGLLPIPGPSHLLGDFFGGWTDAGLQHPGPATPAFLVLGLASAVLLGGNGLLLEVLIVGSVALGAFGVARLLRPLAPPAARLVGAVGYVFLPLASNDVARGDLQALFVFAGMPWVLTLLSRAGRSTGELAWQCVRLGLLLGLVSAFAPGAFLLELACGILLALGGLVTGELRSAGRVLLVSAGGALGAFLLCLPWSLTYVQPGAHWSVLVGASSTARVGTPSLGILLRLALGPTGGGLLGWALLAGAGLVLLIGRKERLAWGIRLWLCGLGIIAACWAASEGWLGAGGGALRLLVVPAGVCVAGALGLGAAAIGEDLQHSGLGWRQAAAATFGLCGLAGLLPVLGASLGGRWGLVSSGYDSVLAWTATPASVHGRVPGVVSVASTGRILWLGDPAALPLPGWQITPGLAAGVSSSGLPDASRLWPSANPGVAGLLMAAVRQAEAGQTVQLGHLVAPFGVRYLVVPAAIAPVLAGAQSAPPAPAPQQLLDALGAQSDLHALPSAGGALVFLDAAWRPGRRLPSILGHSPAGVPAPLRSLGVALDLLGWAAVATVLVRRGRRHAARGHHRTEPTPSGDALGVGGSTAAGAPLEAGGELTPNLATVTTGDDR